MFFVHLKGITSNSIPIISILLNIKNVALIYSVTICEQKIKMCRDWAPKMLFLSLIFAPQKIFTGFIDKFKSKRQSFTC